MSDIGKPITLSIGTTAVKVYPERRGGRSYLMVQNNGSSGIRMANNIDADANGGIRIAPGLAKEYTGNEAPNGYISVVSESGTNSVTFQEY